MELLGVSVFYIWDQGLLLKWQPAISQPGRGDWKSAASDHKAAPLRNLQTHVCSDGGILELDLSTHSADCFLETCPSAPFCWLGLFELRFPHGSPTAASFYSDLAFSPRLSSVSSHQFFIIGVEMEESWVMLSWHLWKSQLWNPEDSRLLAWSRALWWRLCRLFEHLGSQSQGATSRSRLPERRRRWARPLPWGQWDHHV